MKYIKRTIVALLAFCLLCMTSFSAYAYTEIDTGKTGSITVSPSSGQSIGTELTIYRVADVVADNGNQKYALTDEFAASGVDLTNLNDTKTLAKTLSSYVSTNKISGTSKTAGTDGSVQFSSLKLGLYLVIQTVVQSGESIVNPFLVSVPMQDGNENWVYDVDASPKAETYELVDITVKKVWNDGNSSSRPSSVTVKLYKDSALVDTVKLNSGNSWKYTWKNLEKSDGYSVSEESVSGYTATYSKSGYTFTVTNTGNSTSSTPGGSSNNGSTLAKTGQLNWPVPLLAGCGVVLFAVGWALVFLKRKTDA